LSSGWRWAAVGLAQVELEGYAERVSHHLSLGKKKRTALPRRSQCSQKSWRSMNPPPDSTHACDDG